MHQRRQPRLSMMKFDIYKCWCANVRSVSVVCVILFCLLRMSTAEAQTIDHSNGFTANGELAANGSATFVGSEAALLNGSANEAGSLFSRNLVNIAQFTSTFEFQTTAGDTADGITFCIQGVSPTALGGSGSALGYGGQSTAEPEIAWDTLDTSRSGRPNAFAAGDSITNSVALKFDLFQNTGDPSDDCAGLYVNGAQPIGGFDLTPFVDLHSGDLFEATMTYDGTKLDVVLSDLDTGQNVDLNYTVSIPTFVGSSEAYVGFTGGTSDFATTADILTWKYISTPPTPTPIFSPNGGALTGPQSVTIADSTTGATIYYTTDGSMPTSGSTPYSGPIQVSDNETLKAIAVASGLVTSAVASATFTVAKHLVVTNTGDSNTVAAGSLRAAIIAANASPESTITFQSGVTGTIACGKCTSGSRRRHVDSWTRHIGSCH